MRQRRLILRLAAAVCLSAAGFTNVHAQVNGRQPLPGTVMNLDSAVQYLQSNNPMDRAFALTTFDYLGPKAQAQSAMVVAALFDSSAEVRGIAVKAIRTVDPNIAGPALALAGDNYQAKLNALNQLDKLGTAGSAALPALQKFLESARPEDRSTIIGSIADVGRKDPKAAQFLANVAMLDTDPSIRKTAMERLGKMDSGPGAVSVFVQALVNGTPDMQKAAINGLGTVGKGNADAQQALTAAATLAKDPKVREQAQDALKKTK